MSQPAVTELAVMYEAMHPARLHAATDLLSSWNALFGGALDWCSVGFDPGTRSLVALAGFHPAAYGPHVRARFEFWAHYFGGRVVEMSSLATGERLRLSEKLSRSPRRALRVSASELMAAIEHLGICADAPNRRANPRFAAPLQVRIGDDTAASYDISVSGLFVKAARAPPIGDTMPLELVFSDGSRFEVKARVTHVRAVPDRNRRPAGFGLEFVSPPAGLASAVLAHVERMRSPAPMAERRERVRVHLYPPSTKRLPLRVRYESATQFAREYADNISAGGLFVQTARPLAAQTQLRIELELPNGEVVEIAAKVVHVRPGVGMGLEFALAAPAKERIEAYVASVTARPMRALVIDDDAFIRRIYADALEQAGFDVLTADDGKTGLEVLFNEMLALDVVVSDVYMPGLDGPSLLRVLRDGGEDRMTVVLVSGSSSDALRKQLRAAGADDVLDKALGPSTICQQILAAIVRRGGRPP